MGSMPKGKVLHQQRVIRRIFSAAEAAKYPVEQIEFTADGKIIVRPRASTPSGDLAKPEPNDFDDGNDQAEARQ